MEARFRSRRPWKKPAAFCASNTIAIEIRGYRTAIGIFERRFPRLLFIAADADSFHEPAHAISLGL